jgi:hypothetical protein
MFTGSEWVKYRVLFRKFNKIVLVFRISPRGDVYK